MASNNPAVKILQVCRVTPSSNSLESSSDFSLPLTFFDTFWFNFPPVEIIFYYQLTDPTLTQFNSVILPRLKHSLSLTLPHFLPLAGNLTWPPHSSKPFILYKPNDGVLLTVAESTDPDSFFRLSGQEPREATESHLYVPELPNSNSVAAVLSLQITFFPGKGFSIGTILHHIIFDGKSFSMFIKAWAHMSQHLCDNSSILSLPADLTPSMDRTVVKDSEGLDLKFLRWRINDNDPPRSLKLMPASYSHLDQLVRASFEISHQDIKKLRERVLSKLGYSDYNNNNHIKKSGSDDIYLSTFVLVLAYTLVCMVRAKGVEASRKICLMYLVDRRARTGRDSPVPRNYFGNCVTGEAVLLAELEDLIFKGENGVALVAERLSKYIKGFGVGSLIETGKEMLSKITTLQGVQKIGIAGSNRFDFYDTNFGWGRPNKVEITSIDRNGSISMVGGRDGSGGVEIGLALKKHEMELFTSLFIEGLRDVTSHWSQKGLARL